jgi:hypothetical protein
MVNYPASALKSDFRDYPSDVGQIGYALAPQVATGAMFGSDQPIILHLLDVEPAKNALEGLRMELVDGAYPLLEGGWRSFSWPRRTRCCARCIKL